MICKTWAVLATAAFFLMIARFEHLERMKPSNNKSLASYQEDLAASNRALQQCVVEREAARNNAYALEEVE